MTLAPTDDERMLREAARGFLEDHAPVAAFRKLRDSGAPSRIDRALWREMAQMGWAGVLVPEEHGGARMGFAAASILADEMGRTLAATPFLSTAVVAVTALADASAELQGKLLPAIAAGETIVALAVDEGRKHRPERIALAARPEGNGFRLDGAKTFVAEGPAADRLIVAARTSGAPGDTGGLTLFLVDAGSPGVAVDPVATVDSRGVADVRLDGVLVDGADVIGAVGEGWPTLERALDAGRAALAAELLGVAAGAFAMTVGYLKERRQFDRPIGSFQGLQHRAAHLHAEIEVTASAVLNAARALDADRDDVPAAVSLAKARAIETARLAAAEGVQMHGGIGMTDEYDIGFYMKRARGAAELWGDYAFHAGRVARARGL